mgnify:CR=1 FL=1
MRKIFTLLLAMALVTACKKDDNPAKNNNNPPGNPTPPVAGDSTLKIDGLDSLITMTIYDSVFIPITIYSDSGIAQNVSVSISSPLPMRMKAVFTQSSGTTPFSTTLKLYTYLTSTTPRLAYLKSNYTITNQQTDTFTITVNNPNGDSSVFICPYAIREANCRQLFYEVYKRSPVIKTYQISDPNDHISLGSFVSDGAILHYDGTTGNLYFSNIPMGIINGNIYLSIADTVNTKNNLYSSPLSPDCEYSHFVFGGDNVFAKAGTDIDSFFVFTGFLEYYRFDANGVRAMDDSTFRINYSARRPFEPLQYFAAIGKLKF